jgi:hypothetical protein
MNPRHELVRLAFDLSDDDARQVVGAILESRLGQRDSSQNVMGRLQQAAVLEPLCRIFVAVCHVPAGVAATVARSAAGMARCVEGLQVKHANVVRFPQPMRGRADGEPGPAA